MASLLAVHFLGLDIQTFSVYSAIVCIDVRGQHYAFVHSR